MQDEDSEDASPGPAPTAAAAVAAVAAAAAVPAAAAKQKVLGWQVPGGQQQLSADQIEALREVGMSGKQGLNAACDDDNLAKACLQQGWSNILQQQDAAGTHVFRADAHAVMLRVISAAACRSRRLTTRCSAQCGLMVPRWLPNQLCH